MKGFRNRHYLWAVVALALLVRPVRGEECFTGKGNGTVAAPHQLTWTVELVLNDAGTELAYTINCCGCIPSGTGVSVCTDAEGFIRSLTGGTCPIKGVWKNTDSVPLTTSRVQALRNGTMILKLTKPVCSGELVAGYLVPESCGEVPDNAHSR